MTRPEGPRGRFLPRRLVGEGGFGRVWLVDDARAPGEPLALKELADRGGSGEETVPEGRSHAERLRREFAALASLRHPGIVEVHDFVRDSESGLPRFTLEFIEGRGLIDACRAGGPALFAELAVQALRTLHFMHGFGLVHRDIKPDNVLVRDRPKLGYRLVFVDFGLALLATDELDEAARAQGTLPYMAPELLEQGAASPRSDLYAIGAVLHEALIGKPPFEPVAGELHAFIERVRSGRRPRPALPDGYPDGLRDWLEALLAPDARDRPTGAAEALSRLDAVLGTRHPIDDEATRTGRLRSGPPAEREPDVTALWNALDPPDRPRLIWLTGAPGSGKSRVLRWIEAEAVLGGWDVVTIAGRSTIDLGRLRERAAARPTLLQLDSADEAAAPTASMLLRVLRDRDAPPLQVIAAARAGSIHHPALRDLLADPASIRLELKPLDEAGVAAMAQRALAAPVSAARVAWLLRASEGSPARIESLLIRAAWERGDHAGDAAARAAEAVPAVLSSDARRWLEALAVVEGGIADDQLAALSRLDPSAARHAAEEAAGCGLVRRERGRWRIESRNLAAGLLRALPDGERTALFRSAAARIIEHGPDDAWKLYRLWREAGERERAVEAALRAAADAADDPAEAAFRYGRALALIERADPRRRTVRLQQAESAMRSGQFGVAVRAYGAARRLSRTPAERLEALAGQSHALARAARFGPALRVAEQARALAETLGDRLVLARVGKDAGVVLARMGHEERAVARLEEARDLLHDAGQPLAEAEALQVLAACKLRLERNEDAEADFERSVELYRAAASDPAQFAVPELKARIGLAVVLYRTRRIEEAKTRLEQVRAAAHRQGSLDLEESALSWLAQVAIEEGRLDEAIRLASEATDLAAHLGDANLIVVHRCRLADAQIRAGLAAGATVQLRELPAADPERVEPENVAFRQILLASAALEAGEDPEAEPRELLRDALDGCRGRGKRRTWLLALTVELERRAAVGAVGSVRPVLDEYDRVLALAPEPPEPEIRIRAGLARARASIARGDADGAISTARDAAQLAERHDSPGFAARCWALLAESESRAGRPDEAARAVERGRAQLERALTRIADADVRSAVRDRRVYAVLHDQASPTDASRLEALYDMIRVLNSTDDPERLLETILDMALQAVKAERGMILVKDEEAADAFSVRLARGLEQETVRDAERYSRRIVAEAGRGRSLLAVDAGTDQRFRDLDSVSLYGIRSLMCVPLRSRGRIVGTVYLDSRTDGGLFTERDLRFVEAFADQAALALENARRRHRLERENLRLRAAVETRTRFAGLVGRSAGMQRVYDLLDKVAGSELPVLIVGESGTGKELVARAVHRRSSRGERPLLSENCAAIPESLLESELFGHELGAFTGATRDRPGLFEQAHRGTIFLDEVGEMSPAMQAKLLRVVEAGELRRIGGERTIPVDVRIVAATHRDLERDVQAGRFRLDLLYRLRVLSIELPPLRERPEDIPLLTEHFLERIGKDRGTPPPTIDPEVLDLLLRQRWPGNVRELENTLLRLTLLAGTGPVTLDHVAEDPALGRSAASGPPEPGISLAAGEREQLRRALAAAGGNRSKAARLLGISRATLYRKLARHEL